MGSQFTLMTVFVPLVACEAAVSFPFPGGDRSSKRISGRASEVLLQYPDHYVDNYYGECPEMVKHVEQ